MGEQLIAHHEPEIYFDRRVPEELMEALRPAGFAHSLVEYGRSGQFELDLALRASPKSPESHATLYAGTTKALDLFHHPAKGFKLKVHSTWQKDTGWQPVWQKWASPQALQRQWPEVETFLDNCISAVVKKGSYLKEGVAQASVSRFGEGNPFAVDREAVVGFRDQETKNRLLTESRQPLAEALTRAASCRGFKWLKPDLTSTECDLLAITRNHDLLAVEIKPATAHAPVAHAPLQAWQYARQFQMWADFCATADGDPGQVIHQMYRQRQELGLSSGLRAPRLNDPLTVRPAVAVRPGYSDTVRERFAAVVQVIRDAGLDQPAMEFYTINLVGRLDPFDPLDPGSWA